MMIDVVKREEKRMDRSLKQWHNLTLSISPFSTAGGWVGGGNGEKNNQSNLLFRNIVKYPKEYSQNNISP